MTDHFPAEREFLTAAHRCAMEMMNNALIETMQKAGSRAGVGKDTMYCSDPGIRCPVDRG
jgi:hypothetical protein